MVRVDEYFRYAIEQEYLTTLKFYFTTMTIPLQNSNDYYEVKDNRYFVKMNGNLEEVIGRTAKEPLIVSSEPLTLFKANMSCITDKVETTFGKAIINYVLIQFPFNGAIPYIEDNYSVGNIEKTVARALQTDKITVAQFLKFVDCSSMLQGLSKITTIAATPKTMTAPTGIKEYKEKLYKEFDKKYGKRWVEEGIHVIEFQDLLKAYDAEYLKDDPTYGILTSGGITDNARSKMYLAFGTDAGFNEDGNSKFISKSLDEGFSDDKEDIAVLFNSSRSGSFSRGAETQNSGYISKMLLRATNGIVIEKTDCGSKIYKDMYVHKDNADALVGRYIKEGNKEIKVEDGKKYIGKTIQLRSPLYCKLQNNTFCSHCVGEILSSYNSGVTVLISDLTDTLMNSKLKKMHTSVRHLIKADPISMIN